MGLRNGVRRKIRESRKMRGGKIILQSSLKTGDKTEASEKMYKTKQGGSRISEKRGGEIRRYRMLCCIACGCRCRVGAYHPSTRILEFMCKISLSSVYFETIRL